MSSTMISLPFFHRKRLLRRLEASEQESTREHERTMRALDVANEKAQSVLAVIEKNGISLTMARAMGHEPVHQKETKNEHTPEE